MRLTQLRTSADDGAYLHLERYVNDGSPSGFTDVHQVSDETSPFTGAERFPLLEFDDGDLDVLSIGEDVPYLRGTVNFAHPDSLKSPVLKDAGRVLRTSPVVVSPASGGRTMVLRDGAVGSGYLKLTYDVSRIGRVDRQLASAHCISSVEVSDVLKTALDTHLLSARTAVLLEPSARISHLSTAAGIYEWGTIFRERAAYPYTVGDEHRCLVPGFSLFGRDRKAATDKPIIVQLIELGGYDPEAYLLDVVKMIVDSYWSIVHACALHIECHGQNCLFEVDSDWRIARLIVKDMDSVDKDIPLAHFLGVDRQWKSNHLCMTEDVYYYPIRASYMYDFKLGGYLLSPLIAVVADAFALRVDEIESEIRSHVRNAHLAGLPSLYFPEDGCWYDCDNTERTPGTRRTYYARPNPKFR